MKSKIQNLLLEISLGVLCVLDNGVMDAFLFCPQVFKTLLICLSSLQKQKQINGKPDTGAFFRYKILPEKCLKVFLFESQANTLFF
jgi:hypothetical protein